MADKAYILGIGLFGLVFFIAAAGALYWAAKHGQLRNFEKGARSIFDEEEPEGEIGDRFPAKRKERSPDAKDEVT
jgi:hypothetical protein